MGPMVRIGTAGWSLPVAEQPHFPPGPSHLVRYAARFAVAEINSSFHRPHRPATYARWAASVPDTFRFSVKLPKSITHAARLRDPEPALDTFLQEVSGLGDKIGAFLVQLPPSLELDASVASRFLVSLRDRTRVDLACEPRHASWFTPEADQLLATHGVARVAADPARVPGAEKPGGSSRFSYYRLHGSPKVYYSTYTPEYIRALAAQLRAEGRSAWCIFDNTTLGAATGNALALQAALTAE